MDKNFKGKHGPLLIAEIGGNHEGDYNYAKKLTQLALEADVDFIKFQIYQGDKIVNKKISPDRNKHFKKFELNSEQHLTLAKYIQDNGANYMASVWDLDSIKWIDNYIPIYKVGSGDMTAYPILKNLASKGKPIIVSTGLATEEEVLATIDFIQSCNNLYKNPNFLCILQCTAMYPIEYSDAHLNVITKLKEITNLTIGYSDHTIGFKALELSYAMGAQVLEFHFTDSRENKNFRDHKVSLTKDEVKELINAIRDIDQLKGQSVKKLTDIEIQNGHQNSFRRAVYLNRNLKKGLVIKEEHLSVLRPLEGIDARFYYQLIGKKLLKDISLNEALKWEYFE